MKIKLIRYRAIVWRSADCRLNHGLVGMRNNSSSIVDHNTPPHLYIHYYGGKHNNINVQVNQNDCYTKVTAVLFLLITPNPSPNLKLVPPPSHYSNRNLFRRHSRGYHTLVTWTSSDQLSPHLRNYQGTIDRYEVGTVTITASLSE